MRAHVGLFVTLLLAACAAEEAPPGTPLPVAGCADVVDVVVEAAAGLFEFSVTVRSADTGWDKYADAWEVRAPDGSVLGVRELLHPHETEQPFTRSLGGVDVPQGITEVTVAAHDSVAGFCGATMTVPVPGRGA